MIRFRWPAVTGLIPFEFKVMPAKTLPCPVVTTAFRRCYSTAKVLKSNGRLQNEPIAAVDPEECRSPAFAGRPIRPSGLGADRRRRAPALAEMPPVLFVHGNGDHAALWITTLWRMESNGVPRDRMFAINFTDPLARTDDKVEQANRSSTEDQRRELADAIKELKRRTGASRDRAGRQFARRQFDPQLHQERRRRRCQPRRAVRRSQPRRL